MLYIKVSEDKGEMRKKFFIKTKLSDKFSCLDGFSAVPKEWLIETIR